MGAIVSLAAFTWDETVVPPATRAMWQLQQEAVQHIAKSDQPMAYNVEGKNGKGITETVKINGGYDARTRTLRDVTIVKYSEDPARRGDADLVLHCDEATSQDRRGLDQRGFNWIYRNCHVTYIALDQGHVESQGADLGTLNVLPNGAELGKTFNEIMNTQTADTNRLSFGQLRDEIRSDRAAGRIAEARGKEVDLYGKIALPIASLIFGVVGAALGLNTQRGGGKTVGFGVAIFIVFLYWVFYHSMFVVGKNGGLPPMLASFLADIVGALVGIGLTIRASR
jgi:lipopolysaccharide export system permease protein